jgi:quercetin dioxygenase-like cupin family protein
VLYYQYGTGIVAVDGGEDVTVPEGNYVILPANTVHMHGCTDDAPALQLSLMRDTQTTFDVACPAGWEQWMPSGRGD